jgi:hypothetical protein
VESWLHKCDKDVQHSKIQCLSLEGKTSVDHAVEDTAPTLCCWEGTRNLKRIYDTTNET